jgi:hypothetical protein
MTSVSDRTVKEQADALSDLITALEIRLAEIEEQEVTLTAEIPPLQEALQQATTEKERLTREWEVADGSFLFRNTTENIMARDFQAGSRIGTMVKDLGLAKSLAKDLGMPLFVTAPVYELFQAGAAMNPEEDNWTIVKLFENFVGVEVKKSS